MVGRVNVKWNRENELKATERALYVEKPTAILQEISQTCKSLYASIQLLTHARILINYTALRLLSTLQIFLTF